MNIKDEKEKDFEKIKVGHLVEVLHLGSSLTVKSSNVKILTYGYVNSKTIGEDDETSYLEVNGNVISLSRVVTFVEILELGDFDD